MKTGFENYLRYNGYTQSSIRSYIYSYLHLSKSILSNPEKVSYREIILYLSKVSTQKYGTGQKTRLLYGMKKYFDYLIEDGKREDHPCRSIKIKDFSKRKIILHDLFKSDELELLMEREERYSVLKNKNMIIVSLLIYQGLNSFEISALNLDHINLDKGKIQIKGSKCVSGRSLRLNFRQMSLFDSYLRIERKNLQRKTTKAFLLGKTGNRISVDDIHYLISTYKGLFPERRLTPMNIRKSVIANWLNEKNIPLEQVQLMAGHKWISTTFRYKQINIEQQRKMINKWFVKL